MAVVDHVEKKGPPPPDLLLKWECDYYRSLPCSGGVLDQPAGLLRRMRKLSSIYDTWQLWIERKPGFEKEWIEQNPDEWETVLGVMSLISARDKEIANA